MTVSLRSRISIHAFSEKQSDRVKETFSGVQVSGRKSRSRRGLIKIMDERTRAGSQQRTAARGPVLFARWPNC